MNTIAETASDDIKKPSTHAGKSKDNKIGGVDEIEIHTETDDPDKTKIHTESDVDQPSDEEDPMNKPSEDEKEERTQRVEVLGPVIDIKKPLDQNKQTEIDKEIVVTGKPKLNGKLTIDTTYHDNNPHKLKNKEKDEHKEELTGFSIDDVIPLKTRLNATSNETRLHTHAPRKKAYHDLSVAHKVLSSNIEKLRNVLKAIEDVPTANNKVNEKGMEVVKKNPDRSNALFKHQPHLNKNDGPSLQLSGTPQVNNNPPYLPQDLSGFKVLKSQSSTQTTVAKLPGAPVTLPTADKMASINTTPIQTTTAAVFPMQNDTGKQTQLPQADAVPHRGNAIPQASAPGLHVIQGNGNLPNDKVSTQASSDVFDHLASELVDHDAASHASGKAANKELANSVSDWMNKLKAHNDSLQETFKELNPDESAKICKSLRTLKIIVK